MAYPEVAEGGCICCAVRYRTSGAPETVILCHCESCRRHSGAPLVALAGYTRDQVSYASGTPIIYVSSPGVGRAFCADCGTSLTWEGDDGTGRQLVELMVATMDHPQDFSPEAQIHHGERLPWLETADHLPRYRVWHDDGDRPYLTAPVAAKSDAAAQIDLVRRYFQAVDAEDLDAVLSTLTDECVFSVETHGVRLSGKDEITGMFRRLWANHKAVSHTDFRFVPDPEAGRISVQFQVRNTELDGQITRKSNCNFFDICGNQFDRVAVYMAGPNTLNRAKD